MFNINMNLDSLPEWFLAALLVTVIIVEIWGHHDDPEPEDPPVVEVRCRK
jgi:hypothetical protein